ncbi:hypothetical protein BHM03_00021076 [Ensete ventricosum]|nr:hypothetical protein BHM03_00021076 [Ensete ventricosum]
MPSNGSVKSNNKLGAAPGDQRASWRSWGRKEKEAKRRGIGDWAERSVFDPRLGYRSCGRNGRGDDGIEASRGHAFDCEPYFGHGREGNPNQIPAEEKSEDKKVW